MRRKAISMLVLLFVLLAIIQVPVAGATELSDGDYTLNFTLYKDNTNESSVMNDYVDLTSGKLRVEDGKNYVSFVLRQSAQTTSFKTEKNGVLVEAAVISSDTTNNTRTVEFEVGDLSARLNAWVKIYWQVTPEFLYDHEYDVDLGFSNIIPVP
ncbi:NEAT domain-containing protein [Paenibacillus piri]|uniref:NEAT domain-containing protein n=1 Tax=Paenibacillus piri TaxID=2547395 RepID=A0A4R5K9A1_9BACL|nr:NEAT domain-containing protein [Paenibacillus piri]TDF91731.1 hypothetical protein E1757_31885 [Paenibacillus piri]